MIPLTILDEIFHQISESVGVTFIREDQIGRTPPYPYGTYKRLSSTPENSHQDIVDYASGIDPTFLEKNRYEKSISIVSIAILDKTMTNEVDTKIREVGRWFKEYSNVVGCQASGVTPKFKNIQIQDRTFFNDNFYVGRFGFDITLEYNDNWKTQIENASKITIEGKFDDTERDIIIGE